MESVEFDELQDLRDRNNELVKKLQYWKVTAAERENQNVELMKEINDLRLKISRLRSGGAAQSRKLDAALQIAGEEALTHLVQASTAVTKSIELAKTYIREKQELEMDSPRWSAISNTPVEKVQRVPPMMGGRSIQPVVALRRAIFNNNDDASFTSMSTSEARNVNNRPVPSHTLQDVYIPLTRIDIAALQSNSMDTDLEGNAEDNAGDIIEQSGEVPVNESQNLTDDDLSQRLDIVTEEIEPEDMNTSQPQSRIDNPMEGPSWLLNVPEINTRECHMTSPRHEFSPTVRRHKRFTPPPSPIIKPTATLQKPRSCRNSPKDSHHSPRRFQLSPRSSHYSPRSSYQSPRSSHHSPRPSRLSPKPAHISSVSLYLSPKHLHHSPGPSLCEPLSSTGSTLQNNMSCVNGRVLKVIVPKMRLDESGAGDASQRKRHMLLDAPSPNGATDAAVIVLVANHTDDDATANPEPSAYLNKKRRESRDTLSSYEGDSRPNSRNSRDSDSARERRERGERRTRKQNNVTYKEKTSSYDSDSRPDSCDNRDSDSGGERGEGRTRRQRNVVTYKEKPLNRKMRR